MRSYSLSVIFLVSFLVCGCSTRNRQYEYSQGLLQSQYMIGKYGQITGRDQDEYVEYLERRLVDSIPNGGGEREHFKLILVNSKEPLAFSPGGGFVLFSKGLVTSLNNEAELAFVLAHELAHQYLGHTQVDLDRYADDSMPDEQKKLELEADRFAIGLVAIAGYDPRLASFALLKAYKSIPYDYSQPGYPDLNTRLEEVKDQIQTSGWQPPGTIDRRDFRTFRQSLIRLAKAG